MQSQSVIQDSKPDPKDLGSNLIRRCIINRVEGSNKGQRPTLDENMPDLIQQIGGSKDYDIRKIIDLARP